MLPFSDKVPQAPVVERYQPGLVTIGIGGNDAGFMAKLRSCIMPDSCEWATDQDSMYRASVEVQSLFQRLVSLYKKLRAISPASRFVAVGYPQIVSVDESCRGLIGVLLKSEERLFMRRGISYINQVIQSAARATGVWYADVESSFAGHELCSQQSDAMNGIRLVDDISFSGKIPMLKIVGAESFHPTPTGHSLVAQTLSQQYHQIMSHQPCVLSCPVVEPPPIPDYAQPESPNQTYDHHVQFLEEEHYGSLSQLEISLPPGHFKPNSEVRVEVHSQPLTLGMLTVLADGSLSGQLTLPDLEEGFHTVHIIGESFGGQLVDVYQGISYGEVASTEVVELTSDDKIATVESVIDYHDPGSVTPGDSQKITVSSEPAVLGVSDVSDSQHSNQQAPLSAVIVIWGVVGLVLLLVTLSLWTHNKR